MAKADPTVRYLQKNEYPEWDRFVEKAENGTIFHTHIWLERFASWQKLHFKILGCFKGDQLTGGMAFTWKKKFGIFTIVQVPLKTPFFGPVVSDIQSAYQNKTGSHRKAIIDSIIGTIKKDASLSYSILTPSFRDIRPFTWSGFHAAVNYTFIGNIREGIDLASGYDPSLKRQIKKGEKLEFDFRKDNSPSAILHARDLEQRSFKRQGLRLEYGDEKGFTEWIMQLCAAGSAQTYMISHHGAAAGQIIILDRPKKTAYYWLAGADQEILPTGLNQLFLHLVLTDLQEQGFEYFDFVGAGTESIARYKSTFNFPLVPFYSINFSRGLAGMALKIKALNNNLLSRRNG